MSKPRKSPLRIGWNSACATCKAIFHGLYSAIVLVLCCATLFAAYVATLDDIPVPDFLIREIRDQLKTKGLTLRMEGIRFQPNGRIIVEQPEFFSPELGSTVVAAETAIAKLKLSHLLFGSVAVDEVRISSGRFVIPAMLTPSGEPVTAIRSINLEAFQRADRWNIRFATCAIDDLKLSAAGRIDSQLIALPKPKPEAPKLSVTQLILNLAPKISQLQEELKRFETPFLTIALDIEDKKQTAVLNLGATRLHAAPEVDIHELTLRAKYTHQGPLTLKLHANRAAFPQGITARALHLASDWDTLIPPDQVFPFRIQASATEVSYKNATLPSLTLHANPSDTAHTATIQLSIPESPASVHIHHTVESKQTSIDFIAQFDSATLDALSPLAQSLANLDLASLAQIDAAVDLRAKTILDPEFKPTQTEAIAQAGPTTLLGASIDYAGAIASLKGPQIDVSQIRLRSGKQGGVIKIGYNLETLFRRILVEGSFDPTLINAWFKPWWAAMWEGMTFPDEGMLTYLDSQATFKRPDTVNVTGTGYVQDFDLRGMQVDELRTKLFSRFHYVDLYDMELNATDGQQAIGEIQFHMDRDTRDQRDKLTGIWIQALSTLDVKDAPNILWEIADGAREILEPYCYDLPPLIEARSASFRKQDEFFNDIDLAIETETNFTFYGFPLESLDAYVHIGDDVIDISRAQASLGGGKVNASAFIIGDELQVDAQLNAVGFGEALRATSIYFAADGIEPGEKPTPPEELLAYGGRIDATFVGTGIVGDSLSFLGDGSTQISEADLGSFRLFGFISSAIKAFNLPILKDLTSMDLSKAQAPFMVEREIVRFPEGKIEGGGAAIEMKGTYNIETDGLNLTAKLFPLRNTKMPIITPLINLPLDIFSNVFEVSIKGTFDEPEIRLFNTNTKEEIGVTTPDTTPRRDHRPGRDSQ